MGHRLGPCSVPICVLGMVSPVHEAHTVALQRPHVTVASGIRELWVGLELGVRARAWSKPILMPRCPHWPRDGGGAWLAAAPGLTGLGQLPWRCWECSQKLTQLLPMGFRLEARGLEFPGGSPQGQQWLSAGRADPKLCHLCSFPHTGQASLPPLDYSHSPLKSILRQGLTKLSRLASHLGSAASASQVARTGGTSLSESPSGALDVLPCDPRCFWPRGL